LAGQPPSHLTPCGVRTWGKTKKRSGGLHYIGVLSDHDQSLPLPPTPHLRNNTTTLDCQVQIELFLGNSLDITSLSSVEDFTPFHDFRPLVAILVWGVDDNANDTSRFSLKIFHN